ncbi:hypothetical protein BWQ96_04734 [Gracilariopsis chorda]|uniref:RING-type domain-containing protein n=1 Tax=Gracilariopsis chorda TaxID=448386 RepID=A0A2V3ITV2_9FLOR|nr:hypothetical protein BWQ96_04734 [Gracilariopsis chorda]|eukprot:PXF45532.1 hypothetical protein BWQ96_04734 [Gracilariopsis chorda]
MRSHLVFLWVLSISLVLGLSPDKLPSPQEDPASCGRTNPSAVCDPSGYLPPSAADTVDGIINFIHDGSHGFNKVPCGSSGPTGAQLAVAVVPSLPFGLGSKPDRAFQLAKDFHDRWGVGDATCQNGVVLVLAIRDRSVGLSVGRGVKNILTDDMVSGIINSMKGKLRDKDYGGALEVGVTAIGNILSGGKPPKESSGWGVLGFLFFVVTCCGIGSCFDRRKRRRYARCKQVLRSIDEQRAAANADRYVTTSCPICLEDFPNASKSQGTAGSSKEGDETGTGTSATKTVRTVKAGNPEAPETTDEETEAERVLPCGHKFHDKCIVEWFSGTQGANTLCPICRQPISEERDVRIENRTNFGSPSGWDVYDPEYRFRMERAQFYYPDYITWGMINSWDHDRYRSDHSLATSNAFVAVDPVVVAEAARASGTSGSTFSFGGGSSAGGGGGGGGW